MKLYNVAYLQGEYLQLYCMAWTDLATARAALASFVRLYGKDRYAYIVDKMVA